ncbi:MAG: RNA polymerase sigma factor [Planctomycetota bacterium]
MSQAPSESDGADRSDEALVAAYVSGERAALRLLIDRHQPDLLRFLIRLTGQREIAEDAFQEAFLQLHLSASRFDTSRRLKPWLYTIAANKARDAMRRHRRQPILALSKPVDSSGGTEIVDLLEIDWPAPENGVLSKDVQDAVQRTLETLTYPMREVLLLAYFQRLSYAQIAEELGIPLGTVKSRLHAAVAHFGRAWRDAHDGSDPDQALEGPHG